MCCASVREITVRVERVNDLDIAVEAFESDGSLIQLVYVPDGGKDRDVRGRTWKQRCSDD